MENVNPVIFYAAIAAAGFITGLGKGGLGGMIGALLTTSLALIIPLETVLGLMLPIFIIGDAFAISFHWGNWDEHLIISLIPGAVLGITLGTYVITSTPMDTLRTILGIIVLLFIAYRIVERKITASLVYRPKKWHGILAGIITGFTSALAHAGGPPIAIFLLMNDLAPGVFVATAALFFAIINLIKVPYYFYAGLIDFSLLLKIAWLFPFIPLGAFIGKTLTRKVDKAVFERILLVLLTISALLLLFKN